MRDLSIVKCEGARRFRHPPSQEAILWTGSKGKSNVKDCLPRASRVIGMRERAKQILDYAVAKEAAAEAFFRHWGERCDVGDVK